MSETARKPLMRQEVYRPYGDRTDEPLWAEIDRDGAVERGPDPLEHHLPEALVARCRDRRPAAFPPGQLHAALLAVPADRHRPCRVRQRAVLGRIGGELVHDQP